MVRKKAYLKDKLLSYYFRTTSLQCQIRKDQITGTHPNYTKRLTRSSVHLNWTGVLPREALCVQWERENTHKHIHTQVKTEHYPKEDITHTHTYTHLVKITPDKHHLGKYSTLTFSLCLISLLFKTVLALLSSCPKDSLISLHFALWIYQAFHTIYVLFIYLPQLEYNLPQNRNFFFVCAIFLILKHLLYRHIVGI